MKKRIKVFVFGGIAAVAAWGASVIAIHSASSGRIFDSGTIAEIPEKRAAVVLGCIRVLPNGLNNLYFTRRIAAAVDLYKAGKVDCLIVSGDNHVKGYDEPSDMKESLAAAGVPADRIVCDYAGFRTLDSVVRAKKVFGLDTFIVISQPDHVRRAVFLARGFGCDAYGYAAKEVNGRYSVKTTIREQLAKIGAVLDVVIRRRPKFLGPHETLPAPRGREGDAAAASPTTTNQEKTMTNETLKLPETCSRLLDISVESNVPIVLDMGEDFCPTLYVDDGTRASFYNLAGFASIGELRDKTKQVLANMPSVKAYLLAYAPACEVNGVRQVLLVMETAGREDDRANVLAVACNLEKKEAEDGLKMLPMTDSLFK